MNPTTSNLDELCAQAGISKAQYEQALAAAHALTIAREHQLRAEARAFLSSNQGDKRYVYGHIENFKGLLKAAGEAKLGAVKRIITRALFLYEGWEMDNYAALVELADGRVVGIRTGHGAARLMERAEAEEKLRETELSAASIRDMLSNWPVE